MRRLPRLSQHAVRVSAASPLSDGPYRVARHRWSSDDLLDDDLVNDGPAEVNRAADDLLSDDLLTDDLPAGDRAFSGDATAGENVGAHPNSKDEANETATGDTPTGDRSDDHETAASDDAENYLPDHYETLEGPSYEEHALVELRQGEVPYDPGSFSADPDYSHFEYNPEVELGIYQGKYLVPVERPWVELGRGLFLPGDIPPSQTWFGKKNLVKQHFLVYGDYRTAIAHNKNNARDKATWAHRLNLDLDYMFTATERIHAFIGPLDKGANFTSFDFDRGKLEFNEEFDKNFDTIYMEGDLGSITGGLMGVDTPFDMPFAFGLVPLLWQNGVWFEDAFVGAIATVPAKYIKPLNWTNYDLSIFAGIDEIDSAAFPGDDSAANIYGMHAAIDAFEGYLEVGYAFLDDADNPERSYHNLGVSFSKRYFHRVSNAIRVIINSGQETGFGDRTAEGQLVILENAFISHDPNFLVPYLNLFAGFGTPQSAARAGVAGGVLRNVGINFETDGLTGYPTLDDTANNTVGGAAGVNILGPDFSWQLILELAWLETIGERVNRKAVSDQYAVGMRYQLPLSQAVLLRCDAMHGFLDNAEDITGIRAELRYKF